jgi:hypothetical protein
MHFNLAVAISTLVAATTTFANPIPEAAEDASKLVKRSYGVYICDGT